MSTAVRTEPSSTDDPHVIVLGTAPPCEDLSTGVIVLAIPG
ncbi:MAG: hypothetical protein WAO28_01570 [Candidatus Microsaccharimonas sp.]